MVVRVDWDIIYWRQKVRSGLEILKICKSSQNYLHFLYMLEDKSFTVRWPNGGSQVKAISWDGMLWESGFLSLEKLKGMCRSDLDRFNLDKWEEFSHKNSIEVLNIPTEGVLIQTLCFFFLLLVYYPSERFMSVMLEVFLDLIAAETTFRKLKSCYTSLNCGIGGGGGCSAT